MSLSEYEVSSVLAAAGMPDTPDNREQMLVFLRAMAIYIEREKHYGGLWKEGGMVDAVHHMKSKVGRVQHATKKDYNMPASKHTLDDAHDLINYAAFFVRLGTDPDRPAAEADTDEWCSRCTDPRCDGSCTY